MQEGNLIEGMYDKDGYELHELDRVLYEGEEYIIMRQKNEDDPYVIHPIGGNPNTEDISLNDANRMVQRMNVE